MQLHRITRGALAFLLIGGALACSGDSPITGPGVIDPDRDPRLEAERRASHSLRWNIVARALVAGVAMEPPRASRAYALLAVAQHATLLAAAGADDAHAADRPLSLGAALVAASATVLTETFPAQAAFMAATEREDLDALAAGGARADDIAAGAALGRTIAERVLRHAASDGSSATWTGSVPTGPGVWYSSDTPATAPMLPHWRNVRPWLMSRGDQFRPPPPPPHGSPEFLAALAEVRTIADTLSLDQLWIAHYWADAPGSHTPPGHWNRIASLLIDKHGVSEREATRALALTNTALMDAGIACWDAKFEYWTMRPWQADPSIWVPVMMPNFPSYVSGHASFSGAASQVLAALFPDDAAEIHAKAEEAAMSRLYGAIHYRYDNDQGLVLGRRVGNLAIALLDAPGSAPWQRYLRR